MHRLGPFYEMLILLSVFVIAWLIVMIFANSDKPVVDEVGQKIRFASKKYGGVYENSAVEIRYLPILRSALR